MMTPADYAMVIPIWTVAALAVIREIGDQFRRQAQAYKDELKTSASIARNDTLVTTLDTIKQQTNGATSALLAQVAELLRDNGELRGLVKGLQTPRAAPFRATDLVTAAPAPAPLPAAPIVMPP
jgi:hypothetical protein